LPFYAADADPEGVVDHQFLEPAVEAGAARIGMDIGIADLDRLRGNVGTQPGGHADERVPGEDRIGHAKLAADQRIETLVEMLGIEARRIDEPDIGIGGAGSAERLAMRLRQPDELEGAVGEFDIETLEHQSTPAVASRMPSPTAAPCRPL